MLVNISSKVLNMQRILNQSSSTSEDTNSKPVLIVSCFGTDEKLVKTLKSQEDDLLKTNSFKNSSKRLFTFVKKTGPNIGNMLSVVKSIALGKKLGIRSHVNCMQVANAVSLLEKPSLKLMDVQYVLHQDLVRQKTVYI